jgi:hypothetical protein
MAIIKKGLYEVIYRLFLIRHVGIQPGMFIAGVVCTRKSGFGNVKAHSEAPLFISGHSEP